MDKGTLCIMHQNGQSVIVCLKHNLFL